MNRFLVLPLIAFATAAAAEPVPNVVVSIKPIHSLVSGIMAGVGEPGLIVDGAGSPHAYSLRPSQAARLQDADVIFRVGDALEPFLDKPIATIGSNAEVVALVETPGLLTLDFRDTDDFAGQDDPDHGEDVAADHPEDDHGATDPHVWLDPENAKVLVDEIARVLANADPANADAYAANAAAMDVRIDALIADTTARLAPVKGRSFVAFHDGYRYFEERFGVRAVGAITVSPEVMPGASRLADIRDRVRALGATCVFAEPQFTPKLVMVVTEGTAAKAGVLDPLGTTLDNGPDLYFSLIDAMAQSMRDCLSAEG